MAKKQLKSDYFCFFLIFEFFLEDVFSSYCKVQFLKILSFCLKKHTERHIFSEKSIFVLLVWAFYKSLVKCSNFYCLYLKT